MAKLVINLLNKKLFHRRYFGGGTGQLIAKAVGIKPHYKPNVIDCTAGMGEDAFILACLGCKVLMLERSSEVGAALTEALYHVKQDPSCQNLQLELKITDAITYLKQLSIQDYPDVIYLDPMFPERKKTALSKKEISILRDIVGTDLDAPQLLAAALPKAKKRIVVKRHRLAPAIEGPKPNFCYRGKSSRFDIYLPHTVPTNEHF